MVNFKQIRIQGYIEKLEQEADLFDENGVVNPEFIIDEEGRSICTKHTEYKKMMELDFAKNYPNEFELMLTCLRCNHYKEDHCYFPKAEIDKIEKDRLKEGIRCQLCGMKIHRLMTILHSFYYKQKFGVEMPIICCTCYAALNSNDYMNNTKKRMLFFGFSLMMTMYFLISYFSKIFFFSILEISLIIGPLLCFLYIAIKDLKSLYYLYRGRKYYQEIAKKAGLDGSFSHDHDDHPQDHNGQMDNNENEGYPNYPDY